MKTTFKSRVFYAANAAKACSPTCKRGVMML
jgi:hypothetical protein